MDEVEVGLRRYWRCGEQNEPDIDPQIRLLCSVSVLCPSSRRPTSHHAIAVARYAIDEHRVS